MVHNDEQPFNVPHHVNCGLRTFGIHACVAKFSYKPSRPLRGLNYRRDAFSIAYLRVNIFKIVPMLLAKRKLLRRGLEEDRGRMCSQTLSSSHRLLLSSQPNLRFNNPLLFSAIVRTPPFLSRVQNQTKLFLQKVISSIFCVWAKPNILSLSTRHNWM